MTFWLVMLISFLFTELLTVNLVSIWFVFGCFIAGLSSYFIDSFIVQTVIFLVSSITILILARPFVKRVKESMKSSSKINSMIGKTGFIIEEFNQEDLGKAKVEGQIWPILKTDNKTYKVGDKIVVKEVQGIKLIIERAE